MTDLVVPVVAEFAIVERSKAVVAEFAIVERSKVESITSCYQPISSFLINTKTLNLIHSSNLLNQISRPTPSLSRLSLKNRPSPKPKPAPPPATQQPTSAGQATAIPPFFDQAPRHQKPSNHASDDLFHFLQTTSQLCLSGEAPNVAVPPPQQQQQRCSAAPLLCHRQTSVCLRPNSPPTTTKTTAALPPFAAAAPVEYTKHDGFLNPSKVLWSSCARMLLSSWIYRLDLLFISLLLRFKFVLMCCVNIYIVINYEDCLGAGVYVFYVPCESLRQINLGFIT
ncbi:uncharacterized protein LOC124893704 [Capsicum annuum]|uniref:uncharacterized protein LOC124893704 n=1 Tax=Capsicum annuum TaxID=4072 RepID=UPI001FB0A71B|nr:uncharacterized protein LOC124893704 [Capsicum annuum]